jgi:hypothetical protein
MEDVGFQYFSQDCRLGDKRLTNRLFRTFDSLAKQPTGTLPQKLRGRAELVGGYRMFNNPKVTHQALLQAHQARCLQQLQGYNGKLLLLHDTTLLDYSGLHIEGLGPVGNGNGKGLYAHNTLAVIPSSREVIGLLNQILHKQAKVPKGETKNQRKARPLTRCRLCWERTMNCRSAEISCQRYSLMSEPRSETSVTTIPKGIGGKPATACFHSRLSRSARF